MRKVFAVILLCVASVAWCSTEYLRPTADTTASDGGGAFCEGVGVYLASSSMSAVYSGKSGTGPTGSSATLTATYTAQPKYELRIFNNLQTTSKSYSALTINISLKYSATGTSAACAYYTTDNWNTTAVSLGTVTTSQATLSKTITGANLTQVQVEVIAVSLSSGGSSTVTVYDIWTVGTYTAAPSGHVIPPQIISYLDEQIWRWHDARREHLAQ